MPPIPEQFRTEESGDPTTLAREIIALSVADRWDAAKLEWELLYIYVTEPGDFGTCLCGHYPIREHCVLVNKRNGTQATVGNVCVSKFLGLPTDKLFTAFARIKTDPRKAINAEAIAYAADRGWMNDWERGFYLDTLRKRRLSDRQRATRIAINRRILSHFSQRSRR